jgi:DNA-binding response OmpR family regulator
MKPPLYRDEHLLVSLRDQLVILESKILTLTRTEYRLTHAGEVVPRPILLMLTPTMDMHLSRLRQKVGTYFDRHIETVIGVGYRFRQILAS